MRLTNYFLIGFGLAFATSRMEAQTNAVTNAPVSTQRIIIQPTTNYLGLVTNGPAVMELCTITTTAMTTNRFLPPRLATNPAVARVFPSTYRQTNASFREFKPESLSQAI